MITFLNEVNNSVEYEFAVKMYLHVSPSHFMPLHPWIEGTRWVIMLQSELDAIRGAAYSEVICSGNVTEIKFALCNSTLADTMTEQMEIEWRHLSSDISNNWK